MEEEEKRKNFFLFVWTEFANIFWFDVDYQIAQQVLNAIIIIIIIMSRNIMSLCVYNEGNWSSTTTVA